MSEDVNESVPTQENIQNDLQMLFRGAICKVLMHALDAEVERLVGAPHGKRASHRHDFRNGSYSRSLMTTMGNIEVDIPRTREHGAAIGPLTRYARRTDEIDDMIVASYVSGVSTRKMGTVTTALLGKGVSRSTVSRVTKSLEEALDELRNTKLTDEICYLYVDATFLKARYAREVESMAALVAYGVGRDGHRKLLAVTVANAESQLSWTDLFSGLIERGLHGVQLIISDAHAGLINAVRSLFPEVPHQRCTVHLTRNVMAKAPRRLQSRLGRELSRIFAADSLADAKRKAAALKLGLGSQLPDAMACLDDGFTAATRFFAFPKQHWRRLRSTNGVERINAEIKRRTRAVGAFPDRASAARLVSAVCLQVAKAWAYRPYLDMQYLPQQVAAEVTAQAA